MASFQRRRDKKFSKKMQRSLDPAMLLSRGMSARFVGANVMQSITTLSKEEIEKDLRHMNAYYHANVAYQQQHYIYMNREELGATGQLPGTVVSNAAGPPTAGYPANNNGMNQPGVGAAGGLGMMQPPIAMPVRIDPEEEKRLQNLRKKIALCETQREFLESQYVSLRAHYVATTKELKAASKNCEGLTVFLQTVTKRRGRVLALQRARLQIARDVLACLQTRMAVLETAAVPGIQSNNDGSTATATKMDVDSPAKPVADGDFAMKSRSTSSKEDIVEVWNELEEMLKEAEIACRKIPSTLAINEKKPKKKSKKGDKAADAVDEEAIVGGVIPWDAMKMPNTPQGVPLMLSQLALVPEKGAAFTTNGAFGAHKSSMAWMESSLPSTYNAKEEQTKVAQLRDEVALLEEELAKERAANKDIQTSIIGRRKRSDELVAMMTLLRSETEAILHRHNILLDSPQAKQAARDLHEELLKTRAKAAEQAGGAAAGGGNGAAGEDGKSASSGGSGRKASPETKEKLRSTRNSHTKDEDDFGDDEGEIGEEYDEEGEIKGSWGGKRDSDGAGDDSSPSSRKRRKASS